jgi:uncharacterized protein (TIGR04551 family)
MNDPPFDFWKPIDRNAAIRGGCTEPVTTGDPDDLDAARCGNSDRFRYADMRLRLRPTLSLSDEVRVHTMIDVFDNVVLGSTPEGQVLSPPGGSEGGGFVRTARAPGVPIDSFAATQEPPEALRNSLRDSIVVRRAWAEITNRGLGQLRFGRMGSDWGLGILANDGDGLDADFQSDVDRVMGITKLAGLHIVGAWDWAGEGILRTVPNRTHWLSPDATNRDDINQLVLAVARRTSEEKQQARLQRGDWVLNGGVYFVWRKQDFSSAGIEDPFATLDGNQLVRRGARAFIPDLWAQFKWGNLRLETEMVLIAGEIQNTRNDSFLQEDLNIRQFGWAFEGEYQLLEEKLGIHLHTGYATGDADVNGISNRSQLLVQNNDDTISTFRFHPNYRIDLILWRNVMGRVAGAYYMKPGVNYDFIKNAFGQRLGARADVIYSRAAQEVQTPGADPNLGVELNLTAYYQSEDGPGMTDGFHARFQYGVLFPLDGLGYPTFRGNKPRGAIGTTNAQTVRLLMGVRY